MIPKLSLRIAVSMVSSIETVISQIRRTKTPSHPINKTGLRVPSGGAGIKTHGIGFLVNFGLNS